MNSVIYYFSGSGNSYKIAKNVAEKLGNVELIRICTENMNLASQNKYNKIGIVFPVYFFSLPKMVREFVENLHIDKDSYIYSIATCGGFVGISLVELKKILGKKGYHNLSTFKLLMPDNYQVLYAPSSVERQLRLIDESNIQLEKIISIIRAEKIYNEKEPNVLYKNVGGLGAKIFNPKDKDKNFWADEKCNGCEICAKVCPAKDIIIKDHRPKWLSNCEQCLACMQWCPQQAIQYKKATITRGRYTHPEVKVKEMMLD